jgi:hypothetical protein
MRRPSGWLSRLAADAGSDIVPRGSGLADEYPVPGNHGVPWSRRALTVRPQSSTTTATRTEPITITWINTTNHANYPARPEPCPNLGKRWSGADRNSPRSRQWTATVPMKRSATPTLPGLPASVRLPTWGSGVADGPLRLGA